MHPVRSASSSCSRHRRLSPRELRSGPAGHGSGLAAGLRWLRLLVPHTGSMSVPEPGPTPLPERMQAALDGFGRHLAAERGLSPHTVRAYLGDVRSLLEHAAGDAITAPDGLD